MADTMYKEFLKCIGGEKEHGSIARGKYLQVTSD
jgi:hypothetical protein